MKEREVISITSALVLAFLSSFVSSLKMDFEENVFIGDLFLIGLSIAVPPRNTSGVVK